MNFFENMGWERDTGKPTPKALEWLDLGTEAKGLWKMETTYGTAD